VDNLVKHARYMAIDLHTLGGGTPTTISYVFSNTYPGSPLRRLLVDSYGDCDLQNLKQHPPDIPGMADFYFELAKRGIAAGQGDLWKQPWEKECCAYHDHRDHPQGYSCTPPKPPAQKAIPPTLPSSCPHQQYNPTMFYGSVASRNAVNYHLNTYPIAPYSSNLYPHHHYSSTHNATATTSANNAPSNSTINTLNNAADDDDIDDLSF